MEEMGRAMRAHPCRSSLLQQGSLMQRWPGTLRHGSLRVLRQAHRLGWQRARHQEDIVKRCHGRHGRRRGRCRHHVRKKQLLAFLRFWALRERPCGQRCSCCNCLLCEFSAIPRCPEFSGLHGVNHAFYATPLARCPMFVLPEAPHALLAAAGSSSAIVSCKGTPLRCPGCLRADDKSTAPWRAVVGWIKEVDAGAAASFRPASGPNHVLLVTSHARLRTASSGVAVGSRQGAGRGRRSGGTDDNAGPWRSVCRRVEGIDASFAAWPAARPGAVLLVARHAGLAAAARAAAVLAAEAAARGRSSRACGGRAHQAAGPGAPVLRRVLHVNAGCAAPPAAGPAVVLLVALEALLHAAARGPAVLSRQ